MNSLDLSQEHIDLDTSIFLYKLTIDRIVPIAYHPQREYKMIMNNQMESIKLSILKEKQWFVFHSQKELHLQVNLIDLENNEKEQVNVQLGLIDESLCHDLEFEKVSVWIRIERIKKETVQNDDPNVILIKKDSQEHLVDYQIKYYSLQQTHFLLQKKHNSIMKKYQRLQNIIQSIDQEQEYVLVPFKKKYLQEVMANKEALLKDI